MSIRKVGGSIFVASDFRKKTYFLFLVFKGNNCFFNIFFLQLDHLFEHALVMETILSELNLALMALSEVILR